MLLPFKVMLLHEARELVVFHLCLAQRLSAGTAGAGGSVETGWRVKVTKGKADTAAPAVVQPRLVRPLSMVTAAMLHG
jgi:hypothetical protein